MAAPRALSLRQRQRIERLVDAGETRPAWVYEDLKETGLITGAYPSKRSVERYVRQLLPPDQSEPWSFDGDDPDDAPHVLAVLPSILAWTAGAAWPSRDLATQIVRVRKAIPEAPPLVVYVLAIRYQRLVADRRPSRGLDVVLATRSWESEAADKRCDALLATLDFDDQAWAMLARFAVALAPKSDEEIELHQRAGFPPTIL